MPAKGQVNKPAVSHLIIKFLASPPLKCRLSQLYPRIDILANQKPTSLELIGQRGAITIVRAHDNQSVRAMAIRAAFGGGCCPKVEGLRDALIALPLSRPMPPQLS